jgi:hypothetical protein
MIHPHSNFYFQEGQVKKVMTEIGKPHLVMFSIDSLTYLTLHWSFR